MKPKVAIVILNWNGRDYLEKFLPSVLASTWPNCEVVIVDNASTDHSPDFIKEKFPAVTLIRLPQNFGYAKGYNEGLKQVFADYYVLLNSDVEVEAGWIEPVIAVMESDATIGAAQPKLLMYDDKTSFEYAGAAGGWLDVLGYPFARGRIFDICEHDTGQYDAIAPVFWASGAAMFVRAAAFHRLKGLDDYFFAHQEEIDFCWRLQLAGYKIMACPASRVYHVGGGTLPKGNQKKVYLNFRNNLIMLAKNLPPSQLVWKIPLRILLDVVSASKSLFAGEATYFIAVLQAHTGFLRWLMVDRRKSNFPERRNGVLQGYSSKSVVWKHFISRKDTFAEIIGNNE